MDERTGQIVSNEEYQKLPKSEKKYFCMLGDFTHDQIAILQQCKNRVQRRVLKRKFLQLNKKQLLDELRSLNQEKGS